MNLLMSVLLILFSVFLVILLLRKIINKNINLRNGSVYIFIVCAYGVYYVYNVLIYFLIKSDIITDSRNILTLGILKSKYVMFLELIPIIFIIYIVIYYSLRKIKEKQGGGQSNMGATKPVKKS